MIFDLNAGTMMASCSTEKNQEPILSVAWNDSNTFATSGPRHLQTYTIKGKTIDSDRIPYNTKFSGKIVMTVLQYVLDGQLCTGGNEGSLCVWQGRNHKPFAKHTKRVQVIERGVGNTFWSGGFDCKLVCYDSGLKAVRTIEMDQFCHYAPQVHSFAIHQNGSMVVATKGATVVELKPDGTLKGNVTHGHYRGVNKNDKGVYPEVWGCAVHPSKHLMASCGSDYTVRIWDSSQMLKISE